MNPDTSFFSAVSPLCGLGYCDQPDLNVPQILDEENIPFTSDPNNFAMGVCGHWASARNSPLTPLQGLAGLHFSRPAGGDPL